MFIDRAKTFVKKLNIKSFVFIYILMYTIMPIVAVATSRFLTTYFYMLVVVVSVLFTFYACRLNDIREYAFLLIPFILYELLTMVIAGSSNVFLAGYQVLLFLLPICLGYSMLRLRPNYGMYSLIIAILFSATIVTTVIGCIRNPDAARILATTKTSQDPVAIAFLWQNIGGYNFVYCTVLLYPCVILAYKMKKLPLIFVVIFAALTFTLAINSEYTYALLMIIVSTFLLIIRKNMSLGRFIMISLIFIAALFIFRELVALILTRIGEMIGNPTMTEKMTAIFLGKEAVESLEDKRGELYMASIQTFLNSPFFGTIARGGGGTGGHSFILDNLAQFGLIGAALMGFMYHAAYKVFYRPLKDKPCCSIVFWIFIQMIILSTINTGMWLHNMCLFTPIILCWIYGAESFSVVHSRRKGIRPVKLIESEGATL